jgi:hypothetical protein
MLDVLSRLPGVLVLIVTGVTLVGAFFGAAIGHYTSRKTMAKTEQAQDRLVSTLEKTVARETAEKEDYRKRLHDCRDHAQALEISLKEAQSRPDVSELMRFLSDEGKRRDDFDLHKAEALKELSVNMAALAKNMEGMESQFESLVVELKKKAA